MSWNRFLQGLIDWLEKMKKEENISVDEKNTYENYLTQRGLEKTINSLNLK